MPPNSKSNNSLLNLRRSTAGVLTPDLVTTKSVLLNSRAPLFKPKATCSWQKTVVQKRTPVLPPFETCCKQGSVSAQKVRTPSFYTSPGASSLDNVVIKRVIKYCRNIDSEQRPKKEPIYGENKTSKTKIYLSEGVNKWERRGQGYLGVPPATPTQGMGVPPATQTQGMGVPPATPTPGMGVPPATPTQEYLENVQYVQCLADFKGKRRLSTKLSEIVKFRDEQKKKEEVERKKFQAIAEKREQDLLKVVQRNEIYALNEAMKRLEESNFKEYVEKRNSSCHDNEKNGRNRLGAV
ncbi:hypothetical protein ACHWQZ_G014791 [Mnemiopsis leidyi]